MPSTTTATVPPAPRRRGGRHLITGLFLCGLLALAGDPGGASAGAAETAGSLPARALLERGRSSLRSGAFGAADASLEAALEGFARAGDPAGQCETLLLLAQTDQLAGQYKKALERLERALPLARESRNPERIAAIEGSLGNAYLGLGDATRALTHLSQARDLAREAGSPGVGAAVLNNLGNLYLSRRDYEKAIASYRESAGLGAAGSPGASPAATVNWASAALRSGEFREAARLLESALAGLSRSERSYATSFALINAGLVAGELRGQLPDRSEPLLRQAHDAFSAAVDAARELDDPRTLSYALGYLGNLYEEQNQLGDALELTRGAILAAQKRNVSEALYRWQWQSGRILARLGKPDEAAVSYRHAIRALQSIREEMSSCYANPDASYQKSAGVVCLELVDLLLRSASRAGIPEKELQPILAEARDTLEVLKVFELREYFKDDCLDASRSAATRLDQVSERAVIVYPVLLPDRVELLVSFSGRLQRFVVPVGVGPFTSEVRALRRTLMKRTTGEYLPHAQKLYDWLIRPMEAELAAARPDTLVFVPDGALRTVPMGALHDGTRFLIERYPVAVTPSLNLTDPRPVNRERANLLSLGLTRASQGFPGLPYVSEELESLHRLYGGKVLLNEEFLLSSVESELQKSPVSMIHIASHGQFGGESQKTFLLAFDEKFTMETFGQYVGLFRFRDEPLDLLTLSACETAAGDDRAALGLAGVAVRAGARSALATLWHVNDPASFELIVEFYRQLRQPEVSRARALQAAQIKLLGDQRYDHPGYWAPFLMINNWL